jgi:hypothetical protein
MYRNAACKDGSESQLDSGSRTRVPADLAVRPPSRTAIIALARNDFYEQLSCTLLSITTQFLCGVVSVASADGKGNGFTGRGLPTPGCATHWEDPANLWHVAEPSRIQVILSPRRGHGRRHPSQR